MSGKILLDGLVRTLARNDIGPLAPPDRISAMEFIAFLDGAKPSLRKSMIPLFDFDFYAEAVGIDSQKPSDAIMHFLGQDEAKLVSCHPLIHMGFMRLRRPDLFVEGKMMQSLLRSIRYGLVDPSPFFSLSHWSKLNRKGDKAYRNLLMEFAIEQGHISPCELFDASFYARQIRIAGSAHDLLSHFARFGDRKFLRSSHRFEPAIYTANHPQVDFITIGPLEHYLTSGMSSEKSFSGLGQSFLKLAGAMVSKLVVDQGIWRAAYETIILEVMQRRSLAENENIISSAFVAVDDHETVAQALNFHYVEIPKVDIIIACHNQFEKTVECLLSLSQSIKTFDIRIILVDDASTDPRMAMLHRVPGVISIRNSTNKHFLLSNNAAFSISGAPYLLLLNNDVQVAPSALKNMLDLLESDLKVGAVGPKILYPDGRLQEAGSQIDQDGRGRMLGHLANPSDPAFNFTRKVDFISGACLMIRTESLRGNLFDEVFAPAYYEDVDLCLRIRKNGYDIMYEPLSVVMHHLSSTTARDGNRSKMMQSVINRTKLFEKWSDELSDNSSIRVLSFYLPQFHPTPQNDLWWGRGFTEWSNVTKSEPSYVGHLQPYLPADLGFYDLRLPTIMGSQHELANRYFKSGFVVYYYNFGGEAILQEPLENLVKSKEQFDFCICWANENWTRNWDGGLREPLLTQTYDDKTIVKFIQDALRLSNDSRYIRINGRPLIIIYRPLLIARDSWFADLIRTVFREKHNVNPYLAYVESMESINSGFTPANLGYDASIEFPPHGIGVKYEGQVDPIKDGWNGKVFDYAASVVEACTRPSISYARHPCVFPSWDNTPRQPFSATSFHGASPEIFGSYVAVKAREVHDKFVGEEKLLFVNAWNEWAEGAHLEPDLTFGHMWLSCLRDGLLMAKQDLG